MEVTIKRTSGKEFFKLNAKLGPIWFLRGVNYWRYVEYPWVINNLGLRKGRKVLDVGSSRCSLLPLLLASKGEHLIYITDIDDQVLQHIELAIKLGLEDEIKTGRLVVEKQDVTALTYQDETFDRVTAVSLLEHIADQGDTKAVKELSRVLKAGGLAVLTVPYNYKYKETFVRKSVYQRQYFGKPIFYQRHYDSGSLLERLIEPSGLRVKKIEYFGETGFRFERVWDSLPLSIKAMSGWMRPLFSTLLIRKMDDTSLTRAMAAFLVLEKSA
jgi:cyclopropane fatty-acyl-phospholipid synthase-like methyltransferase